MTKEDIIAKVKTLHLPKDSYVVFGSCPMALAGIREANDVDLLVSKEVLHTLEASGWKKLEKDIGDTPLVRDVFEAHDSWSFSSYSTTLEHLQTTATISDGVPFAALEEVRKWKLASGSQKHLADVALIDAYLKKQ